MAVELFAQLSEWAADRQSADVVTLISAPADQAGFVGQMLCQAAGRWQGILVDDSFTKLVAGRVTAGQWNKPVLLELEYDGKDYRVFWDKLSRRHSALILGAGHISQPLCMLLAELGYEVTVVDDRPDFANTQRFPQATQVVCRNFGQALAELSLSSYGAIIIVTRGHRSDVECLLAVIDQPAAYIGMIGSQGRVRRVLRSLTEDGFAAEALQRLRAPIGLDIGAETPVEIALSIVAEIVAVNRSASCRPLSDAWRCK